MYHILIHPTTSLFTEIVKPLANKAGSVQKHCLAQRDLGGSSKALGNWGFFLER